MQLNNFYKIEPDQWMFKDHPDVKSQIKKYKKNPNVDDNDNKIIRADQAMAWKFGLSEDEYSKLTIEA